MAFCIKSTYQFSNSRYWTEDGVPAIDSIVSPTKYSTESEAQSFIDSYKTNWIGFQKSIGLTFSVVEV